MVFTLLISSYAGCPEKEAVIWVLSCLFVLIFYVHLVRPTVSKV